MNFISKTLAASTIASVLATGFAYAQSNSIPQTPDQRMGSNAGQMNSTEPVPKTPVRQQDRTTGPGDRAGMADDSQGMKNRKDRFMGETNSTERMNKAPVKQQDRTTGPGDRAGMSDDRQGTQYKKNRPATGTMGSGEGAYKAPTRQQDRTTGPGDRAGTPGDRGSIQNQ